MSKSPHTSWSLWLQSSFLLHLGALLEHSYGGRVRGCLGPKEKLKVQNSNQICNKRHVLFQYGSCSRSLWFSDVKCHHIEKQLLDEDISSWYFLQVTKTHRDPSTWLHTENKTKNESGQTKAALSYERAHMVGVQAVSAEGNESGKASTEVPGCLGGSSPTSPAHRQQLSQKLTTFATHGKEQNAGYSVINLQGTQPAISVSLVYQVLVMINYWCLYDC